MAEEFLIEAWLRLLADQPTPEGLWIDELDMGGVSATAIVPAVVQRGRVLLFLRGGAEIGGPAAWRSLAGHFAQLLHARAYLPDEDGLAAYRWLLGQGRGPASIVLCGDGSGTSGVLSVLAAARDAGLPLPAGGVVLSAASPALAGVRGLAPILVLNDAEPARVLQTVEAFLGANDRQ